MKQQFAQDLADKLNTNFTEREIVILASTIAQINNWAPFILVGEAE